jgi:1-acyl-sn-glycerol-3-phosphate acyltransferase
MLYLRSTLFYLGIIAFLLVIVGFGPLFYLAPFNWRYFYMTRWAWFVLRWLKLTCNLDMQIEGKENIPQSAAIVLAKHQSAWETIAMQTFLPPQTWVLKRELMWIPIFGWGLAMMLPVAIDRKAGKRALKQVITQGTVRLKRGLWLIIFPEGTRTSPGEKKRYAIGGAMLAEKSGFPVVPICHNAGEFWGKGEFVKRPGTIRVVIGQTIPVEGKRANQINDEAEEWIESTYLKITTHKS